MRLGTIPRAARELQCLGSLRMPDLIDALTAAGLVRLAEIMSITCGVSALLAAILPPANRNSSRLWKATRRCLDVLAANVRNARNRVT